MLLARRARNGAPILVFFALWGVGSIIVSIVGSPIGDNWTRLNEFVFPLMVLTAALARFRPRALVAVALVGALAYNITPYLLLIPYRLDGRPATARFWQPAIDYVKAHSAPGFRVEVVPTAAHWESYWIPRAGIALARGFLPADRHRRQPDLLQRAGSTQRATGSGFAPRRSTSCFFPRPSSIPIGAPREASLLRSRPAGLTVAFRDRNWTIYRLEKPTPLITGPGPARVTVFGHTRIGGLISRPGRYLMRSHYMPFWKVSGRYLSPAGPERDDLVGRGYRRPVLDGGLSQLARASCRRRRRISTVRAGRRRLQLWSLATADQGSLDYGSITDALRSRLEDGRAPTHRVELAVRATHSLLRDAVRLREDGTVFVVTGDIPAMWLRDSAAQVKPLLALAGDAPSVVDLVAGVLRSQVEQVLIDPYANAFNPGPTGARVRRDFRDQSPWVFERKYELDSLSAPLSLAWQLWRATGSVAHVDERFRAAARVTVSTWRREQAHDPDSYVFKRRFARRRDSLPNRGRGAPVAQTGMIWSGFRPSDDACVYGYHVPANALAAVSLDRLESLLLAAGTDETLATDARGLAAEIRSGIARHATVEDPAFGRLYAYEVDGLGNALMLDDANIPSLLSLPYLGFCASDDVVYSATRSWLLGRRNPNTVSGRVVSGVGSGHGRRNWVWPLAIAMEGLTAPDEAGRESAARRLETTVTGDLLFHESVDPDNPRRFRRRWFSWADMLYVELALATVGTWSPGCPPSSLSVTPAWS